MEMTGENQANNQCSHMNEDQTNKMNVVGGNKISRNLIKSKFLKKLAENPTIFIYFALIIVFPAVTCTFETSPGLNNANYDDLSATAKRHIIPQSTTSVFTDQPDFDFNTETNVTSTASKTVLLHCTVHNLGNNSVSWIRHKDLHILSVGKSTYTNDDRFRVVPRESLGDWTFRIQYANEEDSGQYDCQVSTRPPISRTFHLKVIEPRARILRGPEMYVGAGSLINLTCVVQFSPEPLEYLHWYHRERMVRADGRRIFIKTELGIKSTSQLVVKGAQAKDSGIYTCSPAYSRENFVTVHVVTDGYPAAMQGGSSLTLVGHKKLLGLMTMPMFLALFVAI